MNRKRKRLNIIGYKEGEANLEVSKIFQDKATESIKTSELCLKKGYYNNSISRSYYSVYQILVSILIAKGDYKLNSNTHESVIGNFNKNYGEYLSRKGRGYKINTNMNILRDARISVDYSTEMAKEENAERCFKLSIELLDFLLNIFKGDI